MWTKTANGRVLALALRRMCWAIVAVAIFPTAAMPASTPLGGLTVAVSPAGDKLVAGGDTRTVLVLDPNSLAVKQRLWVETTIVNLAFDKAGTTLAVEDTSGTVLLYDTAIWKTRATLEGRDHVAYAPLVGLMASTDRRHRNTVTVNSLADGKVVATIALPAGSRARSLGLSADGKRLAVLMRSKPTPDEPKKTYRDAPKGLARLAREEFLLKNDGKVADVFVFAIGSTKPLMQHTIFYSLDVSADVLFDGDEVVTLSYKNVGARIAPDGAVKLFEARNSYNYGIGVAPDHKLIMTGGLRKFSLTNPDSLAGVTGELPKLPGWPEYFKGFSATADGSVIYGATTAYRVVKIAPDGKVLAVEPVR